MRHLLPIGLALPVLLLLSTALAGAQGVEAEVPVVIYPGDSILSLPHLYIIGDRFSLRTTSGTPFDTSLYRLEPASGRLLIDPLLRDSLATAGDTVALVASYSWLPLSLPLEYRSRRIVIREDSAGTGRVVLAGDSTGGGGLTATDIFGRDFERSGSISRGVTVGTNRDLTVQSGLRLQFRGMVADSVEVLGSLTDEQTPIQPEGTTQTLREIDNIFFEVRSPVADGTLGKFYADQHGSEFTSFRRKLQGVRGVGKFGPIGSTQIVAAVSPGTFRTQEFRGREGDQGPYRLNGPGGERDIVILAGTERVFVDGIEMVRGRENDYVIDYGTGEITFQPRRPITAFNEIVVDFEYTSRRYSRSFLAGAHNGTLLDSLVDFHLSWVREGDDPDSPLDLELSDEDRALLAAAGGDPNGAARSGARLVGRSDTLSGLYRKVDTVVDGEPFELFVYDPTSPEAVWDVSFSLAPDGRGDYRGVAFGQYEFVGRGLGSYLPVVYLPLPALQQVGAFGLTLRPSRTTYVGGEISFGALDRNRLSDLPGASLSGLAAKGSLGAADSLRIAGVEIGYVALRGTLRYLDADFQPIGRISDPEFDRQWNSDARLGASGTDDILAEADLAWSPERGVDLMVGGGWLARGDLFRSTRGEVGARYGRPDRPLVADAALAVIDSRDSIGGGTLGDWTKVAAGVAYRLGRLIPGWRLRYQELEERREGVDTLLGRSFRFVETGPDLLLDLPFARSVLSGRLRLDDSVRYDPGEGISAYLDDSRTWSGSLRGELLGVRNLRSSIDLTLRHRSFDSVPGLPTTGRVDNSTLLVRSESRWSPLNRGVELDAVYDVQTERAARLQRVFVQVPVGQGGWIWVDLDSNGLQSENEFRETITGEGEYVRLNLPTDELFPVVDLDATLNLRITPSRFLSSEEGLGSLLKGVVTESILRLEEKNNGEEERPIYLLDLSRFRNDSTTLLGLALLQQDLYLFEDRRDVNIRLRLLMREGLTRLFSGVERSDALERSIRIRWSPTTDIGLELTGALEERSLVGEVLDVTRAYDLDISALESDLSYRPTRALELGWVFRLRTAEDVITPQPRTTRLTGNEIRSIYSIETKGRLRATLERTVVGGGNLEGGELFSLPFQLTDGYAIGTTWVGRLSFDYRFGANIQATLSYTGRAEPPSQRVVHTGGVEVRAFF